MAISPLASHRHAPVLVSLFAPLAISVAGCATNGTAVRGIAAQELQCPSSSIRVSRVDAHIYRATGCGSSVEVACYDPYESTGAAKGWADGATAGNRSRCESLLSRSTVTSAPAPRATTSIGFDRQLAAKLLDASTARARSSCSQRGGPTGEGHARITFAPDGSISTVALDAPFADTDVGRCLAEEISHVSLPAFDGGPVTVGKHFAIPASGASGTTL